ncbi:Clavaminate synthase-like protein [Byssothecium circinans]|uniref:Clavaminate synthase-like protein n=1 Tax=Byssothecium circinans TaxID=147558 RepID=A0A6A5U6A1_9PLEO|nr:Clavaminate synthase-like protein [Byssothecium circinans]
MAAVQTVRVAASLPTYRQVPETKYELDWADLATLDLSIFDTPALIVPSYLLPSILIYSGFFYITNFGLSQEAVDRQFAIGKELFQLPFSEKLKYRADLENGGYNGYKLLGLRKVRPGVQDNTEIYNIPKFIPAFERPHPKIINVHREEIESFARHINDEVVGKLLVLLAIVLELPENFFLEKHQSEEKSDCHLRYMKYHQRTKEQNEALENVWVKGHTDFGSLTLLFRQPVAVSQVRTPEGQWKHVKPYPGILTNGFLKSSIHRVVAPPPDQANIDRLGVLYFVRPEDNVVLNPIKSAVLEKLGYTKVKDEDAVGVTAGEWVKARVAKGAARGKAPRSNVNEETIIGGKSVKYYD